MCQSAVSAFLRCRFVRHSMPGFSAPGGICLAQICKAKFLIHLHFFIQTGEEKFLSSFLSFPLAVSGYQFTAQALHTIFRTDVQGAAVVLAR